MLCHALGCDGSCWPRGSRKLSVALLAAQALGAGQASARALTVSGAPPSRSTEVAAHGAWADGPRRALHVPAHTFVCATRARGVFAVAGHRGELQTPPPCVFLHMPCVIRHQATSFENSSRLIEPSPDASIVWKRPEHQSSHPTDVKRKASESFGAPSGRFLKAFNSQRWLRAALHLSDVQRDVLRKQGPHRSPALKLQSTPQSVAIAVVDSRSKI